MKLKFPEKLDNFFFVPARYKIAYGGRGGAKSRSFAEALLFLGMQRSCRILCTREVQDSIKLSVHQLLKAVINSHDEYKAHYDVLDTVIRGRNGTEFWFAGLSGQTIDSIKSFEGFDFVWVEEAQTVVKNSWDILTPTIRKDYTSRGEPYDPNHVCQYVGCCSEIWASFNPILDSDEVYQRFVVHPPPSAIIREINYYDNPWFPAVLEAERVHCKATQTAEDYENIWEGKCRSAVAGAIYASELAEAIRAGRLCHVPCDPMLKVHTVWDMGWDDTTVIGLVQKLRSEIRIIGYIEDRLKPVPYYAGLLNSMHLNWGTDFLPWDGNSTARQTGKSDKQVLEAYGRKVKITPNLDVEEGIRRTRMAFPQMVFNRTATENTLIEHLRRYRRSVHKSKDGAQVVGGPVHDASSNGADMVRYIALNADRMTNESEGFIIPVTAQMAMNMRPTVASMGM